MKESERCRILVVGTETKLIRARRDQGLDTIEQNWDTGEKEG